MLVTVCLFVWTMRKMICGLQRWKAYGKISIRKSGSKEDGFILPLMPVHTVAMGKVGLSMVVIGLNVNSQHELFESDHVDENTIDCVEGKATVMTYQEFQNYSPTTNSQRKQSFFCRAFYSTKTRIVRPILGAAKRVKRAQLYSNRVIENAADQANSSDNGSDNEGPNLGKSKRASKRKHKKNHGLNKKEKQNGVQDSTKQCK